MKMGADGVLTVSLCGRQPGFKVSDYVYVTVAYEHGMQESL